MGQAHADERRAQRLRGEHLAQLGRECVRLARLAVFATQEPAVIAREVSGLAAQPLCDGLRATVGQLTVRLDAAARTIRVEAARSASKSGW